jgi:hypothetical protein
MVAVRGSVRRGHRNRAERSGSGEAGMMWMGRSHLFHCFTRTEDQPYAYIPSCCASSGCHTPVIGGR